MKFKALVEAKYAIIAETMTRESLLRDFDRARKDENFHESLWDMHTEVGHGETEDWEPMDEDFESVHGDLDKKFEEFKKSFKPKFENGKLVIWRAIVASKINMEHVGTSWSWLKEGAQSYWGKAGKSIVLKAAVSKEDIDLTTTIACGLYGEIDAEKEIRLKDGAKIQLLEPSIQMATAITYFKPEVAVGRKLLIGKSGQQLLETKFSEFNRKYFNSALKPIPIVIKKIEGLVGGTFSVTNYKPLITIQERQGAEDRLDSLLHEMVHYWVWVTYGVEEDDHGPVFSKKNKQILNGTRGNALADHKIPVKWVPAKTLKKYLKHTDLNSMPFGSQEFSEKEYAELLQKGWDEKFPLVIKNGKILDGNHRLLIALQIDPDFKVPVIDWS